MSPDRSEVRNHLIVTHNVATVSTVITAACLSLLDLYHTVLPNKNYKNYFDFTLNVSTQACPPHRWFQIPFTTVTHHFPVIDLTPDT